eukprot:UN11819
MKLRIDSVKFLVYNHSNSSSILFNFNIEICIWLEYQFVCSFSLQCQVPIFSSARPHIFQFHLILFSSSFSNADQFSLPSSSSFAFCILNARMP